MWIGLCLQWCACPRLKCIEFLEIEFLQGLKWNLGTWLAVWAVPVTVGHTTAMAHVETRPAMNLCRKRRFWVLTAFRNCCWQEWQTQTLLSCWKLKPYMAAWLISGPVDDDNEPWYLPSPGGNHVRPISSTPSKWPDLEPRPLPQC